jgi:hypothetical protein
MGHTHQPMVCADARLLGLYGASKEAHSEVNEEKITHMADVTSPDCKTKTGHNKSHENTAKFKYLEKKAIKTAFTKKLRRLSSGIVATTVQCIFFFLAATPKRKSENT